MRESLEYESHKRQIAVMAEIKYVKNLVKTLVSMLVLSHLSFSSTWVMHNSAKLNVQQGKFRVMFYAYFSVAVLHMISFEVANAMAMQRHAMPCCHAMLAESKEPL